MARFRVNAITITGKSTLRHRGDARVFLLFPHDFFLLLHVIFFFIALMPLERQRIICTGARPRDRDGETRKAGK